LRGLRERLGYSQKEFADMLSIKQQSLSKYESGALNIPDRLKVELLQYGVRIEWLLTGEGEIFVTPASIGERLKAVRLEYEHDIETMADFLTVTHEEYRRYENNEVDPPEEVLEMEDLRPDLLLTYLPHLDYDTQRHGPSHPKAREAFARTGRYLADLKAAAAEKGYQVLVWGDYAMHAVTGPAVALP